MPLLRATLDTNCLINLENRTSQHEAVRALVEGHRAGRIRVFVTEMAASERQPGGHRHESFAAFEEWLRQLDCADLERVLPEAYWDIAFWDHAVWGSDSDTLERSIHGILHPTIAFVYSDYCAAIGIDPSAKPTDGRWLNVKCDVQAMWSHIHGGNDVFVTEDKHFLASTKMQALIALGAGEILTPEQAVAQLLVPPRPEDN
jgi:hypothetical protein